MSRRPETLHEWLERYQNKADKAYWNYQDSGEEKYYRQYEECGMIAECIQARLDAKALHQQDIDRRTRNCEWQCSQLLKLEYSRDEVIKLLHDAIHW